MSVYDKCLTNTNHIPTFSVSNDCLSDVAFSLPGHIPYFHSNRIQRLAYSALRKSTHIISDLVGRGLVAPSPRTLPALGRLGLDLYPLLLFMRIYAHARFCRRLQNSTRKQGGLSLQHSRDEINYVQVTTNQSSQKSAMNVSPILANANDNKKAVLSQR